MNLLAQVPDHKFRQHTSLVQMHHFYLNEIFFKLILKYIMCFSRHRNCRIYKVHNKSTKIDRTLDIGCYVVMNNQKFDDIFQKQLMM